MGEKENENALEVIIGPQLASDQLTLSQGKTDIQRLSRISPIEAFVYPAFLLIPKYRGGGAAEKYVNFKLNLNMSVEGWRARQLVQITAASKGVATIDAVTKPGWAGRNITNRKWKEDAEREGKEIIE